MAFTPPKARKTLSPFRRLVRRVFLAIAILWLLLFTIWRVRLNNHINQQFARIRAAGLPASPAEVNTWLPSVPDAQNGALILTQAFTHRVRRGVGNPCPLVLIGIPLSVVKV